MGAMGTVYKILVGKPKGKERGYTGIDFRHRWEDNIKIDCKEIGFKDVDWIHLAQDTAQKRVIVDTVL
jgi:hypothetical protein